MTLTDSSGNPVTTLNGASATDRSQSFRLIDPTRVKFATSFENATADVPVTIALGDPTIFGPGHTLTPYSAVGGSTVTFDPTTGLDTSDGSIYVGPGSGLYAGEAVVYNKAAGPSVTISATGDDINLAQSTAGSGGLIAGSGAQSTVYDTSTTKAYIADADIALELHEF